MFFFFFCNRKRNKKMCFGNIKKNIEYIKELKKMINK